MPHAAGSPSRSLLTAMAAPMPQRRLSRLPPVPRTAAPRAARDHGTGSCCSRECRPDRPLREGSSARSPRSSTVRRRAPRSSCASRWTTARRLDTRESVDYALSVEEDFEEPILDLERRIEALSGSRGGARGQSGSVRSSSESSRPCARGSTRPSRRGRPRWSPATHGGPTRWTTSSTSSRDSARSTATGGSRTIPAIVCGFGVLRGRHVMIIGHQKGRTTKEKIRRNFGMPRPEGYRKALRAMRTAEKFARPILTLHRHARGLPGHRGRGARPGRGDRLQPA